MEGKKNSAILLLTMVISFGFTIGNNSNRKDEFDKPELVSKFKALHHSKSNVLKKEKVVGLDYYFNDEWKKDKNGKEVQYHYTWEDTANSGYSELGDVIKNLGAEISELHAAPAKDNLRKINIYIIVDPDTPQENPHPNYIDDASIKNIADWVKAGGVLVLFANDKGNCEFGHFNKLAGNFRIHFNEDSRNYV
ncbi:MAG: DUF4350 domain-containing protein [Bacteroidetes bacterium]|nr:DUF4350 domain-containing protein [Bacteroidota bacterium]